MATEPHLENPLTFDKARRIDEDGRFGLSLNNGRLDPTMPAKKPFPLTPFEEALSFAQGIQSQGTDQIKRLTLLDLLNRKPGSGKTRDLITHSATYGLTTGSYNAEFITLTENGRGAIDATNRREQRKKHFDLAISRIGPFNSVFKKFKGKARPKPQVLEDELEAVGVASADTGKAMSILVANLTYLDAIEAYTGVEHIVEPDFDKIPVVKDNDLGGKSEQGSKKGDAEPLGKGAPPSQPTPSLHIDIQVHIDSSAGTEQIDQIFKSMAIHLYGNRHE